MCIGVCVDVFFFLMIRRPPRSTLDRSSAASDVYKRQEVAGLQWGDLTFERKTLLVSVRVKGGDRITRELLSLIHISEPTRPY